MPPKRMTANPARPARHFPGKRGAPVDASSSSEESGAEEETQEQTKPASKPAPAASSFPKDAARLEEVARKAQEQAVHAAEEEFETESSEGSEEEESGSEEEDDSEEGSSSEEESSSDDDAAAKRKLLRPVFIRKGARKGPAAEAVKTEEQKWAEEEARRKSRADALLQEQLEKNAAARAAGKKFWDDEDVPDEVDDTDGVEPEAERVAWKLRELQRVKRERDALVAAEKEREEVERRRNLTAEEREAEDRAFLEGQREEREGRGKMGFMQKYFHKGAYYTDEVASTGLDKRDIMGGRYEDDVSNRELLPQFMQIRDMTKLGKKGRTRYRDLKSEDTGRWGEFGDRRGGRGEGGDGDERFRQEYDKGGGLEASGANASFLGERKRAGSAGTGPEGKRLRAD
ncbi:hypothetical protein EJ06DRAFT_473089 [Trichodelitschia bisporula]|uniref:Micro-fibrillar-associated protein 1 C-terminal domain-containing protein n=1 Tax=Trichodelitschia bisporula TaxID=703511 RepID=A0A6G1I5B3_9PEZI|nr:hypothetical protein EJ06DRAFT_473089 [Trichodelitschia bisporula]